MVLFTQKQVDEIIQIIQQTHWIFIATNVNPQVVPKNILQELIKLGFKESQVIRYPELALQFGMLSVYLKDKDIKSLTFDQLKKALRAKKFVPLTEAEKAMLTIIEHRAVEGITGLGNRISSQMRTLVIEGDLKQRRNFEKIIKDESYKAAKRRESVKYLVSEIGHKTNDWARDLDRIADFILHEAYDNGRAIAIQKNFGSDASVYKRVHKDACHICKKLYIKNSKTGEPRVFKLSDLMGNGTNIGVPQKDWTAVIGATHPWCRCDLEHIPYGYIWSDKQQRFVPAPVKENKRDFRGTFDVKIKTKKVK